MNQIAMPPLTTLDLLTDTQASTNIHIFSDLPPLETSTIPTFAELLAEYQATLSKPEVAWSDLGLEESTDHNALSQTNLARPQPISWLWHKRLPLSGLTLLDGDHGCGKSLLALQIAASVSSGHPLPDGSPTIQGGVVIVSPHNDATTMQLLTALGADLARVEVLSAVEESPSESHPGGLRPFSIPEDFPLLLQAMSRVDARLVILDPLISLLSRNRRWTDQRIGSLLADLKLHLIEHHVACLLVRNCTAKGGHARPSILERSDHFENLAKSRLLLAPDPLQPDRLLLSHVTSHHRRLTPTLTLQIQPDSSNPDLPRITALGTHSLQARDFINHRPDTLHRQILTQHLLQILTAATDPIHVSTLYASSPHSSPFQIQRSLNDLLRMGQIERPTRGFYTLTHPNPVPSFKPSAATSQVAESIKELKPSSATSQVAEPEKELKSSAATSQNAETASELKPSAAISQSAETVKELKPSAATSQNAETEKELKLSATTSQNAETEKELKSSAITSSIAELAKELKSSATTSQNAEPAKELKSSATTSQNAEPEKELKSSATTSQNAESEEELKSSAAISQSAESEKELKSSATTSQNAEPVKELKPSAATTPNAESIKELKPSAATTPNSESASELKPSAATSQSAEPAKELKPSAATSQNTEPVKELKPSAATSQNAEPEKELKSSATTSQNAEPEKELKPSAAISQSAEPAKELKSSATTSQSAEPEKELKSSAAISQSAEPAKELKSSAATSLTAETVKELKPSAATTLKASTPKRPHKGRGKHRTTKKRH